MDPYIKRTRIASINKHLNSNYENSVWLVEEIMGASYSLQTVGINEIEEGLEALRLKQPSRRRPENTETEYMAATRALAHRALALLNEQVSA